MPTGNKPDFFIVGAPKCGTTSLYSYLAGHPDVGMSKEKEPHFFAPDILGQQRSSRTLAQYLINFEHTKGKRRIGEASTGYLASRIAPREIRNFNPSAQIIVMVRNPIDVLHSLHNMRLVIGSEHITNFELAIDSQDERYWQFGRFRGERVPSPSYREMTRFSEQIQRYFAAFGRERVHVILFDDLCSAPRITYERVLSFLGLGSDGKQNFEIVNGNRQIRSKALNQLLQRLAHCNAIRSWRGEFPTLWQQTKKIGARLNFVYRPRPAIEARLRQRLEMEYASEIRNLERLLGRALDRQSRPATS